MPLDDEAVPVDALVDDWPELLLLPEVDPFCDPKNCGTTVIEAVPMLLARLPSDATKRNVSTP